MHVSSISIPQPFQSLHVLIVQLNLSGLEIFSNSRWSDGLWDNCIASVKAEGDAHLKHFKNTQQLHNECCRLGDDTYLCRRYVVLIGNGCNDWIIHQWWLLAIQVWILGIAEW